MKKINDTLQRAIEHSLACLAGVLCLKLVGCSWDLILFVQGTSYLINGVLICLTIQEHHPHLIQTKWKAAEVVYLWLLALWVNGFIEQKKKED